MKIEKTTYMKKSFLIISFTMLTIVTFSQNYFYGFSNYSIAYNIENGNNIEENNSIKYRIENKIKEKKTIDVLKKERIDKDTSVETYNKAGRIISIKSNNYQFLINYFNDTILISSKSIYKKDTTEYFYEYDTKGFLKNYKTIRNGKINSEVNITKNTAGKITNRLNRYGRKLKKSSEMKYYFDNNNHLTKSERYVNGKLKNIWNYDCKPEGEIIKNKKIEEKSVCKWNENNSNGYYIVFHRTTDKEKSYLNKSYYTKDSIFYKSEQFLNDTIKVYEYEKNDFYTISKTFNKKGDLRYENIQLYTESKLLKSNYYTNYKRRKSTISERNYLYNNLNLISTSQYFFNKKMKYQTKFQYSFFE